jgi:hypothetical protein
MKHKYAHVEFLNKRLAKSASMYRRYIIRQSETNIDYWIILGYKDPDDRYWHKPSKGSEVWGRTDHFNDDKNNVGRWTPTFLTKEEVFIELI